MDVHKDCVPQIRARCTEAEEYRARIVSIHLLPGHIHDLLCSERAALPIIMQVPDIGQPGPMDAGLPHCLEHFSAHDSLRCGQLMREAVVQEPSALPQPVHPRGRHRVRPAQEVATVHFHRTPDNAGRDQFTQIGHPGSYIQVVAKAVFTPCRRANS
jgi:hypothetical protein